MFRLFLKQKNGNLFCVFLLFVFSVSCNRQSTVARAVRDTINRVTYQNPVFNHDFPDPNLVKANDGYFYAYSTNANWKEENFGGQYTIPILRSKNLINWQVVGDALPKKTQLENRRRHMGT